MLDIYTYMKKHACEQCVHEDVCVHRKQFTSVVEAINRLMISTSENTVIYCRDLKWLAGIIPICKNYHPKNDGDDGYLGLG